MQNKQGNLKDTKHDDDFYEKSLLFLFFFMKEFHDLLARKDLSESDGGGVVLSAV